MDRNKISILAGYFLVYSTFLIIASNIVSNFVKYPTGIAYWIAYAIATIAYVLARFYLGFQVTRIEKPNRSKYINC